MVAQAPRKSLHDIMNDMVHESGFVKAAPAQDENAALERLDPLLGSLAKEQADAAAKSAWLDRNERRGPMAAIARDMADSARSAYETRLLELHRDRRIMALARRMTREARRDIADAERKAAALNQLRWQLFSGRQAPKGRQRESEQKLNLILSLLCALQVAVEQARATLCLADDFAQACQAHGSVV